MCKHRTILLVDLPPEASSFITRVCGFGFHIRRQLGQARRARSRQVAQAIEALGRVFGCPEMSAVGRCCSRIDRAPFCGGRRPKCRRSLHSTTRPLPGRRLRSNLPRGAQAAIEAFDEGILRKHPAWTVAMRP